MLTMRWRNVHVSCVWVSGWTNMCVYACMNKTWFALLLWNNGSWKLRVSVCVWRTIYTRQYTRPCSASVITWNKIHGTLQSELLIGGFLFRFPLTPPLSGPYFSFLAFARDGWRNNYRTFNINIAEIKDRLNFIFFCSLRFMLFYSHWACFFSSLFDFNQSNVHFSIRSHPFYRLYI